ncbi:hypothetical protein [Helicobacter sp. MIT 14-3879]|uniref:hypothetical protein n=1 Tax=Helicobacter sp. MIT 14-3879 TaxID=2040649 RepID=UPI0015F1A51E|nr:hypothetical protein [Helicobacter sp. MIT 14-3879]
MHNPKILLEILRALPKVMTIGGVVIFAGVGELREARTGFVKAEISLTLSF